MSHMNAGQPAYQPPAPKKGMGAGAIIAIIAGVVVLLLVVCGGISALVLMPAISKARDAALSMQSMAQMRMIQQGLVTYAVDNGDTLPPLGVDLPSVLAPYGVTGEMFTSPRPPASGPSYFYVPLGNMSRIESPPQTVLLYENPTIPGPPWMVGYADGSVISVQTEAEYRAIIDAIVLPDGTPFTPHK
ncbi:MAG: hypothetical protein SFY69_08135 [Planctomycetota bacterium]|nr:hypothetical protein [Planctomycetota bacterium]